MTKILFTGITISNNFGGPSLLSSTIKVLNKSHSTTKFILLSTDVDDHKWSKLYGVKTIVCSPVRYLYWFVYPILILIALLRKFGLDVSFLLNKKMREVWNTFESADVVIDIRGLIFWDSQPTGVFEYIKKFRRFMSEGLHFLIGKFLGKSVIKYTTDAGPFNTGLARFFAKFYLNKIDLILARSEITKKYLVDLGITTPIRVCPDTAFLLEEIPNKKIDKIIHREKLRKRRIIGISVSHMVEREEQYKNNYTITMIQTINYLIKDLNAFVILIPNETIPNVYNDIDVAKKIYEKIDEKKRVILLTKKYSAGELKDIIGKCGLFIGARYHSLVAAISMCVPTVAISWHHKYFEVLKLVGQEKYICHIKNLSFNLLRAKINKLYKNRTKTRTRIASKLHSIRDSVLEGRRYIFSTITSNDATQ